MCEDGIADVIHVSKDGYDKFRKLQADDIFLNAVLAEGFCVHLSANEGVAIYYWLGDGTNVSSRGATLGAALHRFLVEHRHIAVRQELRYTIIARFQAECPHDGETYFVDHYVKKCRICHATLESV